jgi:hypothetical protein
MGAKVIERTWIVGPLRVRGPIAPAHGVGGSRHWTVLAVDSMTEETAEKEFGSAVKAQAFIDTLVDGAPPVDPLAEVTRGLPSGDKHSGSASVTAVTTTPTPATLDRKHTRRAPGVTSGPKDPDAAPFNLKSVREALEDAGLDPFVEVARVLNERYTVTDADKKPVLDAEGQPIMRPLIGGIDRAKILVELGQYVAPKLKAVEVKVEDKTQLTEAQVDRRIADLFAAHAAAGAPTVRTEDAGQ